MSDDQFDYDGWFDGVLRATGRRCAYDGETGAAFAAWRGTARDELRDVLGFSAMRENEAESVDPVRRDAASAREANEGYERQTWSVRTERGFRVPFHLLLPDAADPPYPVVFALHGHTESGKDLAAGVAGGESDRRHVVEERRDIARQAVRRGFAAVAPDMRAFGELARRNATESGESADARENERPCTRWQKNAQLLGRTLVGERVWDVLRLVEFAEGHAPLDADRLTVCGHSGGGVVALLAAALDDRFGSAVACASVCSFADSTVPIDHCPCNYVPGLMRFGEAWDVAGLVAPRPLRVVAGAEDPIFPIEGTRRAFDRIREIYRGAGAADACSLFVGDGGHRFYEEGAWPFLRARL